MKQTLKDIIESCNNAEIVNLGDCLTSLSCFVESMKDYHPKEVMALKCAQYELLNGKHYNERMADDEVGGMWHGDDIGEMVTIDEVKKRHDDDSTLYDAYVGYNMMFHRLAPLGIARETLMKIAEQFLFGEDDFMNSEGLTWRIMTSL